MQDKRIKLSVIIELALLLLGLSANVLALFNGITVPVIGIVLNIAQISICVLAGYYVLKGYDKPHGNLLRIVMLCFAFLVGIRAIALFFLPEITNAMTIFAAIIIAYMSGRLHKFKTMKYISVIVLLLLISVGITGIVLENDTIQSLTINFDVFNSAFTPAFIWLALSGAYFVRYAEHKEAGLIDANK